MHSIHPPQWNMPSYESSLPGALLIAADGADAAFGTTSAELAGFRMRAPVDFAAAVQDASIFDGIDLILIEAAGAPEDLLAGVLARADMASRERALGIVVAIRPEQIDQACLQSLGGRTVILCDPSPAERAAAVALARWPRRGVVQDARRDTESLRLQWLNEEVARIADTLARLTRGEDAEPYGLVHDDKRGYRGLDSDGPGEVRASEIRNVIRARRARSQFFTGELFADPAWDMLLDLYASELEQRRVSVSSLCIAADVPPTTALRWIGTLHDAGLFERHADPSDRRRAYIALSQKSRDGMRSYFHAMKRAGLPLV